MRRIKLVIAAVAAMVAIMAMSAVPAFAAQGSVRVDCTNNQNQLLTLLSNQSSRQCNNIGNTRGNGGGGNGEEESGNGGGGNSGVLVNQTFGGFDGFGSGFFFPFSSSFVFPFCTEGTGTVTTPVCFSGGFF